MSHNGTADDYPPERDAEIYENLVNKSVTFSWSTTRYMTTIRLTSDADGELMMALLEISNATPKVTYVTKRHITIEYGGMIYPREIDQKIRSAVESFYMRPKAA